MNKKYTEPEILVIDDNPDFAQSASNLIQSKYGFNCVYMCNKDEVIKAFKHHIFKVVVIDQVMPEMKGTDLFSIIKEIAPGIKAIMLTGEASKDEIGKALDLGFASYLNKNEITKLPDKVFKQYASYEQESAKKINEKVLFVEKKLHFFPIITYSIVAIDKIDNNYIDDDSWETVTTIHAGEEQEFEYSIEFEDKITISSEYETKIKTDLDICAKNHINILKNTINSELNKKYNTMHCMSTKTNKKSKKRWSLPKESENVSECHIIKRVIESAPIYNEYRVLIKKECRVCKKNQLFPISIYKQTNKIKTRQIDYYSDGKIKETDTGVEKF